MNKYYITFGSRHLQELKHLFNPMKVLLEVEDEDYDEARQKIFDSFIGDKFCTSYRDDQYVLEMKNKFNMTIIKLDDMLKLYDNLDMTRDRLFAILAEAGYKREDNETIDHYKRIDTDVLCNLNGKAPNIIWEYWSQVIGSETHESLGVSIRAENKRGIWCELSAYSLALDEINDLEWYEKTFTRMWEEFNK